MGDEITPITNRFGDRIDHWNVVFGTNVEVDAKQLAALRFHTKQTQDAHELLDAVGVPECDCLDHEHIGCMSVADRISWMIETDRDMYAAPADMGGVLLTAAEIVGVPKSTKQRMWAAVRRSEKRRGHDQRPSRHNGSSTEVTE